MIVLDTTILVYAKGSDHPLREPCRTLLGTIEDGSVAATTTAEAIQEFAHVRARRRDRADASELAAAYVDLLAPLLLVEEAEVREGLRLFDVHPELGAFDAVLAAAVIASGAEALVSADRAFGVVQGLRHVDPATPELAHLIQG
ncbi:MAG TPA: type II toxin-antitoxin system VapC family toxin [Actinomycetota bacterium]|nr:type II toxin-antitoxin system VapC family toxin [Actinomycetota bacterium]